MNRNKIIKDIKSLIVCLIAFICFGEISAQNISVPNNLNSYDIDENSATLSWDSLPDIYMYVITYKVAMSNDSIIVSTPNSHLYIDNLVSSSQYVWSVKSVSFAFDTSLSSNTASFYTSGYITDCLDINGLSMVEMNSQHARIQWMSEETPLYWEVVCDSIGTNPDNTGIRLFTDNLEVDFNNLTANKNYQFSVRSHCSQSNTSQWQYMYAKFIDGENILNFPIQLSYGDTTNNYLGHIISPNSNIKYAYLDFNIPEDAVSYYIDFQYKSSLVSDTSGMKVYLVPSGSILDIMSLPSSIYSIGNNLYNNTNNQWVQEHIELPVEFIGTPQRLLFAWVGDDSFANNFDSIISGNIVEINNVYLTARYCAIPDTLWADNITSNSAVLHWNMTNNQIDYNLQYKKDTETDWTTLNGIGNNYVLDNLSDDANYFYRIQSNCTTEQSFYSDIDTFHTNIIVNPPTNLSAETTYDSAYLSWNTNGEDNYYIIYWKTNDENIVWQNDTSITNSIKLGGLQPNTQYIYKVRTINFNFDTSIYSEEYIFKTKCAKIDTYPYQYQYVIEYNSENGFEGITDCYDSIANILYSPVFDMFELDLPKISLEMTNSNNVVAYISTNGGISWEYFNTYAPSATTNTFNSYSVTSPNLVLQNNVRFKFIFNLSHNDTTICKIRNITIENACSAPRNIIVDTIADTYASFSWSSPQENTSWHAYIYDMQGNEIKHMYVNSAYCTMAQLDSATTYRFVVKSMCQNDTSINEAVKEFTTLGTTTTCYKPTGLTAYWFNSTKAEQTIVVKWDSVDDVSLWEVGFRSIYSSVWSDRTVSVNPTFSIRNLEQGGKYLIRVRAICNPGYDTSNFAYSDTVFIGIGSIDYMDKIAEKINIYPNPCKDIFYIDCDKKILNAVIIDSQGKKIISYKKLPKQIDLSNLTPGVYLLQGYIDDKYFTKKILKQ